MKIQAAVLSVVVLASTTAVQAQSIDWSTVTLSGPFPNYSFTDPQLGTVSLVYSLSTEDPCCNGLNPTAFPEATLMLGRTGDEQLNMSWTNAVQSLDLKIWDIDSVLTTGSNEAVMFTSTASSIAPSILHPSDVWTPGTTTLSSDGSQTLNTTLGNFSIITFQDPATFNSINFNWTISGPNTGILGIGRVGQLLAVPEPSAGALVMLGLLALLPFGRPRRRRRVATQT